MSAFGTVGKRVVKIVVATNSAESSITLPDVDNVICLGSCKEVWYFTDEMVFTATAAAVRRSVHIPNVYARFLLL